MASTLASFATNVYDKCVTEATRPFLQSAELRVARRTRVEDLKRIPIIINNRNRLGCMRPLLEWLVHGGYSNVWILDNDSSYPPLLRYYERLPANVNLVRLGRNVGPRALFDTRFYWKLCRGYFVLTDPDVVPVDECPRDAIAHFLDLLNRYPWAQKAGFGLKIDDLPTQYARREKVIAWESQFWNKEIEPGVYDAILDTTFALYRPWTRWRHGFRAVRTGDPYVARHLPWYVDSENPDEEERFYAASSLPGASSWVGKNVWGDAVVVPPKGTTNDA